MEPMAKAKHLIEQKMPDAIVEVSDFSGTGDHVALTVTSDAFEGKRLIEQHQMIMDILKEEFTQELHAVKIKTMTRAMKEKEQI